MRFQPSNYGTAAPADPAAPAGSPPGTSAAGTAAAGAGGLVNTSDYVSAAHDLLFGQDARTKAAALQAQIDNYTRMAQTAPGVVRNLYVMQIQKLQAEKAVLDSEAGEQHLSDLSAVVGKSAVAGIAVVGVGVAVLVGYNLWLGSKFIKKRT